MMMVNTMVTSVIGCYYDCSRRNCTPKDGGGADACKESSLHRGQWPTHTENRSWVLTSGAIRRNDRNCNGFQCILNPLVWPLSTSMRRDDADDAHGHEPLLMLCTIGMDTNLAEAARTHSVRRRCSATAQRGSITGQQCELLNRNNPRDRCNKVD